MHNDFEPVHLREANAKLDRHKLSSERYQKKDDVLTEGSVQPSLWKKFVNLLKKNPFELPEEFYK